MTRTLLKAGIAAWLCTACTGELTAPPGQGPAPAQQPTMASDSPVSTSCECGALLKPRLLRLAATELREHVRRSLPGASESALQKLNLQAEHLAPVAERAISGAEFGAYYAAAEEVARSYVADASDTLACRTIESEESCLRSALRGAVDRLYRAGSSTEEWASFEATFHKLSATQNVGQAAAATLTAALVSPRTLYQTERADVLSIGPSAPEGGVFTLAKSEALSLARFALTGRAPEPGELSSVSSLDFPAFRDELARLASSWVHAPEFQGRALQFLQQRFGVKHLAEVDRLDPVYTPEVKLALSAEFSAHVWIALLSPNGSFDQLFTTRPAGVFPGLEAIYGSDATTSGSSRRQGVLGLAGLLAAHAGPAGSDPVKRGLMVRVELLCEAMPPPIPDANFSKVAVTEEMQTRERFEALAAIAACKSCHEVINPAGYLFEEFDQVGRYRAQEKGRPINAVGTIPPFFGGEPYPGVGVWDGIMPLSDWLAQSPRARTCFAAHFASYLLAEGVPQGTENCELAKATARFSQTGRLDDLAADIVKSDLFLYRYREAM